MTFEKRALGLCLDTFRHDSEVERVSHHHDRADQGALPGARADVIDEGLVDLQHVHGQSLQSPER